MFRILLTLKTISAGKKSDPQKNPYQEKKEGKGNLQERKERMKKKEQKKGKKRKRK